MAARILVDGYNLLRALHPRTTAPASARADALERERDTLLQRLQAVPTRGEELVIVFDGRSGLGRPSRSVRGALRVHFSRTEGGADELLLRLVRSEHDRSRLLVVTSDREVAEEARRLGARVVSSQLFAKRLGEAAGPGSRRPGRAPTAGRGGRARRTHDEKPPPPSAAEVARWEELFREGGKDYGEEDADP